MEAPLTFKEPGRPIQMDKSGKGKECEQEHTRMHKRYYLKIGFALFFLFLYACTPSVVRPKNEGETYTQELIVAKEQDILAAASEAIQSRFPNAIVSGLSGKEKGLIFSSQPFADRPPYKFVIKKTYGMTPEGNDIIGYQYFIYAGNQLLSIESPDVQPLIKDFKDILAEKGITLLQVTTVRSGN